ncbi:MAG: family 1 glycosylhydrolase [Porphyrobacter sp.]|nr:family 1 glycosylhydrolase [Porphyrobacter sp.]
MPRFAMGRRSFMAATVLAVGGYAQTARSRPTTRRSFPEGFIWGASTAGHQIEGNNTASDTWFLENIQPTVFKEPSGDAANSFVMWEKDLDLCVAMGLNAYRFSVEWARIEPEEGKFSAAMLDHYKRMIDGCRLRGLRPIVTFNHFTSPRWFAIAKGWLNPQAPDWFARYCDIVMRAMGDGIRMAITFNEPNLPKLIDGLGLPKFILDLQEANLDRATELTGSERFVATNIVRAADLDPLEAGMLIGHDRARQAIKAVRRDLPVGLSLALIDDQAQGSTRLRDAMRERLYGVWLRAARSDDFLGVQNYERVIWGEDGKVDPPEGGLRNFRGVEVYPPSLAGAVRYAHEVSQVPILVTEHGVGTDDDTVREAIITGGLDHLHTAIGDGVPVLGYCHWSLLLGLHSVDRVTFKRTPKRSAYVYEGIARANAI